MKRLTPEHRAYRLLTRLGDTPDEVAGRLRQLKVKGNYGALTCPLAVYLRRRGFRDASVYDRVIAEDVDIVLPQGCRQFVTAFDAGSYSDLYKRWQVR